MPHDAPRPPTATARAQYSDDVANPPQGQIAPETRRNDEIGAPALLGLGHLAGADGGQPGLAHPGPAQHTPALDVARRRHQRRIVAILLGPDLEQQRHVQYHQATAPRGGPLEKTPLAGAHHGVEDALEPRQRVPIGEHPAAEPLTVDPAIPDRAGKGRRDRRHRGTPRPQQGMHLAVGIEDGHAEPRKDPPGGRLAHANGAGEPQDHHHPPAPADASSRKARNSAVTSGSMPNQAAKPGLAWYISMPNPSTTTFPRAAAAASSGVSRGL